MLNVSRIIHKIRNRSFKVYQYCKWSVYVPKCTTAWIIYEQLYTFRPVTAKASVFGNKFIENRLLCSINIIYVFFWALRNTLVETKRIVSRISQKLENVMYLFGILWTKSRNNATCIINQWSWYFLMS